MDNYVMIAYVAECDNMPNATCKHLTIKTAPLLSNKCIYFLYVQLTDDRNNE